MRSVMESGYLYKWLQDCTGGIEEKIAHLLHLPGSFPSSITLSVQITIEQSAEGVP